MKALIQRVSSARVIIGSSTLGAIKNGLLIFIGIVKGDTEKDVDYIVQKTTEFRVFEDNNKRMNLSVRDAKGSILVISQFTLASNCRKGNRPSFDQAEEPARAEKLYNLYIKKVRDTGIRIESGRFGAYMQIELINNGPVTFLIDSRKD